eukprot:TRINITY_DN8508_c0_g1_i1.p1 TRINITY_DN8508_c0_g1~~TRINITY_DN8508_c0_g1_i1.p1  ORF type:complete len:586 (+),score=134.28 TRINITY_DN8508_c0_g1_i1:154-1911(+)
MPASTLLESLHEHASAGHHPSSGAEQDISPTTAPEDVAFDPFTAKLRSAHGKDHKHAVPTEFFLGGAMGGGGGMGGGMFGGMSKQTKITAGAAAGGAAVGGAAAGATMYTYCLSKTCKEGLLDNVTNTSVHSPTVYKDESTCKAEATNFGNMKTPEQCAARVAGDPNCGEQFMFSEKYPSWGCRCCKPRQAAGGQSNPNWKIYRMPESLDPLVYAAGKECGDQGTNFGNQPDPATCAAKVGNDASCGQQFMFSQKYKSWGCRCCKPGAADGKDSTNWTVYSAGTHRHAIAEASDPVDFNKEWIKEKAKCRKKGMKYALLAGAVGGLAGGALGAGATHFGGGKLGANKGTALAVGGGAAAGAAVGAGAAFAKTYSSCISKSCGSLIKEQRGEEAGQAFIDETKGKCRRKALYAGVAGAAIGGVAAGGTAHFAQGGKMPGFGGGGGGRGGMMGLSDPLDAWTAGPVAALLPGGPLSRLRADFISGDAKQKELVVCPPRTRRRGPSQEAHSAQRRADCPPCSGDATCSEAEDCEESDQDDDSGWGSSSERSDDEAAASSSHLPTGVRVAFPGGGLLKAPFGWAVAAAF